VSWKISENRISPGYFRSPVGRNTRERIGPVGVAISTIDSLTVIASFHLFEEFFGRFRDVLYGCVEGGLVYLRRLSRAADFAHELQRRGRDFIRGNRIADIAENFDASAHFRFPNHYATVASTGMPFLHEPTAPRGAGLVLTHGAGANFEAPLLVAVANAFCAAGFHVFRCNLAFRERRPFGPPSPAKGAADRAGLREAADYLRTIVGGKVILGGHSYGGRQASMLAAEDPSAADALLLLSYPLHPPEKPAQLRTQHFPALRTPALFVHGTKDPFGTPAELTAALELIPGRTQMITIEKAGHDLARGKFDLAPLVDCDLF
jgi:predicted alpha/beta-hydrolase family hydrolase